MKIAGISYLIIIFIMINCLTVYASDTKEQCIINNKHELIDSDRYTIEGLVVGSNWKLIVDNKVISLAEDEKFLYEIDLRQYEGEWLFISCDKEQNSGIITGGGDTYNKK